MKNNRLQKDTHAEWKILPFLHLYSTPSRNGLSKPSAVRGSGYKMVNMGELFKYDFIDEETKMEYVPMTKTETSNAFLLNGDLLFARQSLVLAGVGKCVLFKAKSSDITFESHLIRVRLNEKNALPSFYFYFFKSDVGRARIASNASMMAASGIRGSDLQKIKVPVPPIIEQSRIVSVFEVWDKSIKKLKQKIEVKKQIKKYLMWDLLTGRKRLSGFTDTWQTFEIGELLDYEQPTKYIVSDTDYSNEYKTPVLTANKGFILGYTNETSGIYKSTPVIIFDDFTMDNKFVDFDFKVKSSAIKILTPKNKGINLKFVFERIQLINSVIGEHRRHYLSEYQFLTIDLPNSKEQSAIEMILTTADKEISELEKKLSIIKEQKRFLLNNLITGNIRTPETLSAKITS
jgi:type I restriction enzyme S subunit